MTKVSSWASLIVVLISTVVATADEPTFLPRFIAWHQSDPVSLVSVKWDKPIYNLIGWKFGDGRVERDLYRAGFAILLQNPQVMPTAAGETWKFDDERIALEATLTKATDRAPARIRYAFKPKVAGMWSVAYAGAPEADLADVVELFQPLVWDGRRLPEECFLTPDDQCSIPGCLVETKEGTVGVMADPRQFPFEMPSALVRRFGVSVRNAAGKAQPLVFTPLPGFADSKMKVGDAKSYEVVLVVGPKPLTQTFEYVARTLGNFRDVRENVTATLNEALDNMLAMAQGPFGNFDAKNKAYSYPDSPGSVKNVSALHPIGLAIATDDEKLFRDQGAPILEFLLSREKFLFALDDKSLAASQTPSRKMAGPAMPVSELAALDRIARGATPYFRNEAERLSHVDRMLNMTWVSPGDSWQNELARYRATGDKQALETAVTKANRYIAERIEREPADFAEAKDGTFFEYMVPAWKDLYELYTETKSPHHLAAAHRGARRFAQFVWFYPAVPDGDVTVNETGLAPRRGSLTQPGLIQVDKATVPAWRVSEQGTLCEGNGTVQRLALYLATHAPWFMRIGQDADDPFLRAIGRSAVVGRYANFPGYHFNTKYSTVHEAADFPLRPFDELKPTTSMHYNHILPTANLVLDFLVAEAYQRSRGAVDFPMEYAESYAFLQGRVYGGGAGQFYDVPDARLWMPAGLVRTDNRQVNYVAARAPGKFCVALMNECERALEKVTIRLDAKRFTTSLDQTYRAVVWRDNVRQAEAIDVVDGAATVNIGSRGITSLVIEGLGAKVAFQDQLYDQVQRPAESRSIRLAAPVGEVQATVISFGPKLTWLYAYATADDKQVKSATLHVTKRSGNVSLDDETFPFEFSVPLDVNDGELKLSIEMTPVGEEKPRRSETATLK